MTELHVNDSEQAVLRYLLAAEPQPGEPLPGQAVFEGLHRLVPCDALGAVYSDLHGRITKAAEVTPRVGGGSTMSTALPPQPDHDGAPFYLGFMRWREHAAQAECCGVDVRNGDGLSIGYRNGTHAVVQYFFDRVDGRFTPRDLALLAMIGPVLQRLVRERPAPRLPRSLTFTERQVLNHVAAGRSNAEIAVTLCISVGTVRKHLENAYRKLGVTNRVAAIARLRGSDEPGIDLQERLDRYA